MNKSFAVFFLIFATIFALSTLAYVAVDVIIEVITKRRQVTAPIVEEKVEVPVVIPAPVVVPVTIPEIVPSIDAESADEMITDALAMSVAKKERGAHSGQKHFINIGLIDRHFSDGDTVTLEALKTKGLINKKVQRLKILADGTLTKSLTVKAESYSIQAIKMIELTGGTVIILE
jgi:ribosomal protein L15